VSATFTASSADLSSAQASRLYAPRPLYYPCALWRRCASRLGRVCYTHGQYPNVTSWLTWQTGPQYAYNTFGHLQSSRRIEAQPRPTKFVITCRQEDGTAVKGKPMSRTPHTATLVSSDLPAIPVSTPPPPVATIGRLVIDRKAAGLPLKPAPFPTASPSNTGNSITSENEYGASKPTVPSPLPNNDTTQVQDGEQHLPTEAEKTTPIATSSAIKELPTHSSGAENPNDRTGACAKKPRAKRSQRAKTKDTKGTKRVTASRQGPSPSSSTLANEIDAA
jgi:hypothetical protein